MISILKLLMMYLLISVFNDQCYCFELLGYMKTSLMLDSLVCLFIDEFLYTFFIIS